MSLFYIEMGQGIIANGNLRVCTSALHSCTLIAGYDARTGYGGAYHYPANQLEDQDVEDDMDRWIHWLSPTAVILVFARKMDKASGHIGQSGTRKDDKIDLKRWLRTQLLVNCTLDIKKAVNAGMTLVGGFNAGDISDLAVNFGDNEKINVTQLPAGKYQDYGRFTLIGKNRYS